MSFEKTYRSQLLAFQLQKWGRNLKKRHRNNTAPTTNHYFDLWYHQATGFYPTQRLMTTFSIHLPPKNSRNQGSPRCFLPRHLSPCHPGSLTPNGCWLPSHWGGWLWYSGPGNFEAIKLEKVDVRWVDSASQNFIPKSLSCWWFCLYTFFIWCSISCSIIFCRLQAISEIFKGQI